MTITIATTAATPYAATLHAATPRAATGTGTTDDPTELIVLVLVDALRPDHMGCYGYGRPTTPHLDALAEEGTRYTRVYANAPWTRPSATSFLTGEYASRHRTETYRSKLPADIVPLAQRLREAGWATAGFTANGNGGSLAGLDRGFDVFEDPTRVYTKKKRGKTYNGLPTGPFVVKRALRWLRRAKAKRQFVYLFLVDPHDPYGAPPKLEKMFLGDFAGKIRRRALWETNNDYSQDERFSMQALYDAGIRYADQALGRFFKGLRAMGRYDSATILVSSDHGEGFGEHGFYLHAHHFWDEVIRIPLIAAGKRFETGVDDRLAQSIDVSATILDLAGLASQGAELPGHSLLAAPRPNPHVISEYNEFGIHRQAIVGDTYKVIWQRPADEAWYLREAKNKSYFPSVSFDEEVVHAFDMVRDPKEKVDLAADLPPEAEALLTTLKAFVGASASEQGRAGARVAPGPTTLGRARSQGKR